MSGNTFGKLFTLTTFGESHGAAVGGVIDGMPAGVSVDMDFIQEQLNRRRPGQSAITTSRKEPDQVRILSGVFEGVTTGAPIGFFVENVNQHSNDYNNLRNLFRPSHADYTYHSKYGIRDHRGGGRTSARITLSRCVAGAFAMLALRHHGISITAFTSQVGSISLTDPYMPATTEEIESNPVRCPDPAIAQDMERLIMQVKGEGDTIGGVVSCIIHGCPAGLGEPEFDKLHAALGAAMLSINAAKGFEYGDGFAMSAMRGSQVADRFTASVSSTSDSASDNVSSSPTITNHSGGIQGGISNGADITFRVAFKPVATILQEQPTIDINGNPVIFQPHGRHDPCVVPRAVPIVEAMAAATILDFLLMHQKDGMTIK